MLGLGLGVDKIRPSGVLPLLDLYPATAAYSLRALSSTTTNVVKVREDGLNEEQDFTAKEITDGTLASFCGANNGFVVTWYDQAGSNNATQATAGSQPKIYDSSTGVVLENGKAALDFDGMDDGLFSNGIVLTTDNVFLSSVINLKSSNTSTYTWFSYGGYTSGGFLIQRFNSGSLRYAVSGSDFEDYQSLNNTNGQSIVTLEDLNNGTANIYLDGIAGTAQTITASLSVSKVISIGFREDNLSQYWDGTIQELIFYTSDQSANRTAIESNINSHYNIYS